MFWALFNDLMQRFITFNKTEQKIHLTKRLDALLSHSRCNVLDFGCGTGLFRGVFKSRRFTYVGYDIDRRFINYARFLHGKKGFFTASFKEVVDRSPFDLIMANCCFHHIDDQQLHVELSRLQEIIHYNGMFLLIDLCPIAHPVNWLHKMLLSLERGEHLRRAEEYAELVSKYFDIIRMDKIRIHPFSFRNNVAYYDAVFCACISTKKTPSPPVVELAAGLTAGKNTQ